MRHNHNFFTGTILIITITTILNPGFAQDKANKIDEFITHCYQDGYFYGVALVAEKSKIIFKKSYGLTNMEWNIPNETDTKFRS